MSESNHFRQSASFRVVGIVAALPEELSTLTSRKLVQGECTNIAENILLTYSGAGPVNAGQAARKLIESGANLLISWGCAAALAPNLRPGDLIVPERVLSEQQIYNTDRGWSLHLQNLLRGKLSLSTADLIESREVVGSSIDKQRIHQQTGAVALDMESAAIVKTANLAGLPCLVIRAIADPASMDLPQAVSHALNSQGQIELGKLLKFLLCHPLELPALIRLGVHFNAAQKSLKTVAKHLNQIIQF